MAFMTWDDSYSVGFQSIDDQHKKLIKMISDFYNAMQKDDKGAMKVLLASLADYTKYHFGYEETKFDQFKYADTIAHKKEHAAFVDKVLDVKSRFESGKLVMSTEITKFLKDWLIHHIKGVDMKYRKCFQDNNMK